MRAILYNYLEGEKDQGLDRSQLPGPAPRRLERLSVAFVSSSHSALDP